jgi:hypothetical protein
VSVLFLLGGVVMMMVKTPDLAGYLWDQSWRKMEGNAEESGSTLKWKNFSQDDPPGHEANSAVIYTRGACLTRPGGQMAVSRASWSRGKRNQCEFIPV